MGSMIDLDKIERDARAAQEDLSDDPGPLHVYPHREYLNGVETYAVMTKNSMWVAEFGICREQAEFFATCSPDVVLALVARIRELEERNFQLEWKMKHVRESGREP